MTSGQRLDTLEEIVDTAIETDNDFSGVNCSACQNEFGGSSSNKGKVQQQRSKDIDLVCPACAEEGESPGKYINVRFARENSAGSGATGDDCEFADSYMPAPTAVSTESKRTAFDRVAENER